MDNQENGARWIHCPICGSNTQTKVYDDTVLIKFPLYCPQCKKEIGIHHSVYLLYDVFQIYFTIVSPFSQDTKQKLYPVGHNPLHDLFAGQLTGSVSVLAERFQTEIHASIALIQQYAGHSETVLGLHPAKGFDVAFR